MMPDESTTRSLAAPRARRARWSWLTLATTAGVAALVVAPWSGLAAGAGTPRRGQIIIPVEYLRDRSPLAMQGAIVLQYRECFACHPLTGARGDAAAFDDIARRVPRAQIARDMVASPGHQSLGLALRQPEVAAATAFIAELVAPQGSRPSATQR